MGSVYLSIHENEIKRGPKSLGRHRSYHLKICENAFCGRQFMREDTGESYATDKRKVCPPCEVRMMRAFAQHRALTEAAMTDKTWAKGDHEWRRVMIEDMHPR